MKQVKPVGAILPPVIPPTGEWGQPAAGVGPTNKIVQVSPNMPSFILAKRKCDGGAGPQEVEGPF